MRISSPEEFNEVELRDLDFTLVGGEKVNLTLRPEDERTESTDAIRVRHAKSGEVVTIHRQHVLYASERTRVVKEKKRKDAPKAA